jgi:endonuclease/exonuclease/phosphatase family metal-dependent hydrolase
VIEVSEARRREIREGPRDLATHARLLDDLGLDAALDAGAAHSAAPLPPGFRAVAWNLERCKHVEASADLLRSLAPDVVLLSEMDWGMARSGNRHTTRELAERLGFAWVYGVEFLELDLGGPTERAAFEGRRNDAGFHGNAILARVPLARPKLVRLERRGDWFDGSRGERRVGGRCAVLAQVEAGAARVTLASVHLDSHGTRANRAGEMQTLLDAIDLYDREAPALIGGDLNCFSLDLAELGDPDAVAAALRADPARWSNPVPHEPLFERAARAGFDWRDANAEGVPTLRHATETGSERGALKIDWFLRRGLRAADPDVIPAVTGGRMLSDHEAIAVALERER